MTDDLRKPSAADRTAAERLEARAGGMFATTRQWAGRNTGSYNTEGLKSFAPILADAFSELDADIRLTPTEPFALVGDDGREHDVETGPVLEATARPDAPVQIILTGHYDTVFPPGTFTDIRQIGEHRWNGPGLADMKGGLVIMREALLAFEASDLKDRVGYRIVVTPDEEVGNFASDRYLKAAARAGAQIGMTYEPCLETGNLAGARKGSAVIDIVLRGRSAHAGRAKGEGRSAIAAAAELVLGLEDLNGQREGVTVNVGRIDAGAEVNVVPDLAVVRLGARAPDARAAAWCEAEIGRLTERAAARDGIVAERHGGFYRPPKPRNAAQEALFSLVAASGAAIGLDLGFEDTGGVCEGNNVFAAGVPNIDTLGVRGGKIHTADEFVDTDSFAERATLSVMILNRLADGRADAAGIKALMA